MNNRNENKKKERFEFILKINGNIICQRYFDIKGYNKEVLNSIELKNLVDGNVEMIDGELSKRSRRYLWRFYDPFQDQTEEDIPETNIWEKEDNFEFQIRVDGKEVVNRIFFGNHYPPRIRYQVDIKDLVPTIVSKIREVFSSKNLTPIEEIME